MTLSLSISEKVGEIKAALGKIGYENENLVGGYTFTSFIRSGFEETSVLCAAFQSLPHSTMTSCIGITENISKLGIERFQFLAAPLIINLESNSDEVELYSFRQGIGFEKKVFQDIEELNKAIVDTESYWSPESIIRAKNISIQEYDTRRDVFDLGIPLNIDKIIEEKLQDLIVRSLKSVGKVEKNLQKTVFHGLFEIIVAKYILDASGLNQKDYSSVEEIIPLLPIERIDFLLKLIQDGIPLQNMWNEVRDSFSLRNISPRHLVHVYENTLVDKEMRKEFGIHATPYDIASIIVNSLPIEKLSINDRTIFEPFCGHAPFLVAASNRLALLATTEGLSSSEAKVSAYSSIFGLEIDSLSVEIAKYALYLSSYPLDISTNIYNTDAFKDEKFDELAQKANIILC